MTLKIAITGRISSGKSFIAAILGEKLPCIWTDSDKMVSEIYKDKKFCALHFKSNEEFSKLLNSSNVICKKRLKKEISENPQILDKICAVIYPELRERISEKFELYSKDKFIIFEIPLLFEENFDSLFDFIINVTSHEDLKLQRSVKKGVNEKLHKFLISRQLSNEERNKKSNFIINNDENNSLDDQIERCLTILRAYQYQSKL